MSEDPKSPEPEEKKHLDYAHGSYNPPSQLSGERSSLFLGGFLGVLVVGFVGGVFNMSAIASSLHARLTEEEVFQARITLAIGAIIAAGLIYLGIRWRRGEVRSDKPSERRSPIWQGFIIGAGLAILIAGGCYATIR